MAFVPTSGATSEYSCISWAVWVDRQVIWPDEDEQFGWPPELPRDESLQVFQRFFEMAGFAVSLNGSFVDGTEKIAIHARGGKVTHASRQLISGLWTSKMGGGADGSHDLDDLTNDFGPIALYMQRARTVGGPVLPRLYPEPPRLITPDGGILIR